MLRFKRIIRFILFWIKKKIVKIACLRHRPSRLLVLLDGLFPHAPLFIVPHLSQQPFVKRRFVKHLIFNRQIHWSGQPLSSDRHYKRMNQVIETPPFIPDEVCLEQCIIDPTAHLTCSISKTNQWPISGCSRVKILIKKNQPIFSYTCRDYTRALGENPIDLQALLNCAVSVRVDINGIIQPNQQ